MEIQELAEYAKSFIESKTRPEGEMFWSMKDRRPDWIRDMVTAVHDNGSWLPDDFKYQMIVQSLDLLSEGVDPEEPQLEPDVYTHDLNKWFVSHLERAGYVDEATADMGHSDQGVVGDLMMGQIREKEEIFNRVVQALRERLEAIERDEPETFEESGPSDPHTWWPA